MGFVVIRSAVAAALAALAAGPAARGQESAAPAPQAEARAEDAAESALAKAQALCGGPVGILRLSKIKAGGTMDGFLAAAAAHQAWYRAHGYTENSLLVLRQVGPGAAALRDDEVITLHANPPATTGQDEAYRAFVDQYRKSSEIEKETYVCLGDLGVR